MKYYYLLAIVVFSINALIFLNHYSCNKSYGKGRKEAIEERITASIERDREVSERLFGDCEQFLYGMPQVLEEGVNGIPYYSSVHYDYGKKATIYFTDCVIVYDEHIDKDGKTFPYRRHTKEGWFDKKGKLIGEK